MGNERLGQVRQPLVGGTVLDEAMQEEFGLVALSTTTASASACLLRPDWVVTAAHCVEQTDAASKPMPDPSRPGQNLLFPVAQVSITANWGGGQVSQAAQMVTFRPFDVALIRVAAPFVTQYKHDRLINEDQFPYFGTENAMNLVICGAGISKFADASGPTPTPTVNDGKFRIGYAKVVRTEPYRYTFKSGTGDYIAGGDSGGPSFTWVLSGYALVGVHSSALRVRIPGMPSTKPWQWITEVIQGYDAPLRPLLPQIRAVMGLNPVGGSGDSATQGFIGVFPAATPSRQAGAMAAFRHRASVATAKGCVAGFPNFYLGRLGRDQFAGTIFIREGGAMWRDVPLAELGGVRIEDFEGRMRATQEFATAHGFVGGFPTFHDADYGDGTVCGTILFTQEAAEWRDVPLEDLANPNLDDFELRFRATQDYASAHGFVGGFPNFFHARQEYIDVVLGGRRHRTVCGTILLRPAFAHWEDVVVGRDPG